MAARHSASTGKTWLKDVSWIEANAHTLAREVASGFGWSSANDDEMLALSIVAVCKRQRSSRRNAAANVVYYLSGYEMDLVQFLRRQQIGDKLPFVDCNGVPVGPSDWAPLVMCELAADEVELIDFVRGIHPDGRAH